jgi:hypothetical protein
MCRVLRQTICPVWRYSKPGLPIATIRNRTFAGLLLISQLSVLFTDVQMPGMGGEELAAIAMICAREFEWPSRGGSRHRLDTPLSFLSHRERLT